MNRTLTMLCLAFAVRVSYAQSVPGSGPALPPDPRPIHADVSGKCKEVRPGDVVHFTLKVEGVQYARAVYADLQMRLGRTYVKDVAGLPIPDFRNLGGGGAAIRDGAAGNTYHFAFTVPRDVLSGVYHGAGVYVSAADEGMYTTNDSRNVDVTSRTLREVRDYCLIVVSPYGGDGRPLVTNFKGGPLERKVASTTDVPASSHIFLPTR